MTSVHRQGELDNCQSLLDQSRVECKELASKVHSLQNDIDKHKVQTSIAGVSGVSALALMEHFAGVASLQADRLRQLGQAIAGKGHFTLGIGLGQALGSASGGPLPERAGMQEPSSVSGNFIDGGGGALSSSLSPQDSHSQLGTSAWVRHWSILKHMYWRSKTPLSKMRPVVRMRPIYKKCKSCRPSLKPQMKR